MNCDRVRLAIQNPPIPIFLSLTGIIPETAPMLHLNPSRNHLAMYLVGNPLEIHLDRPDESLLQSDFYFLTS